MREAWQQREARIRMKTNEYPSDWDDPKWMDEVAIEWEADKNRNPYLWWLRFNGVRSGQFARMHFATIYNPIPDMVAWLDHLSKGHPTGPFRVDEEGWYLRFWARSFAGPPEADLFELRIEETEFLGFDEDEEGCKVIKTHILLKTRRGPFVARLKRILLGVVKQHRMEVEKSPSGIIDADGWCFGMRGRIWKNVIARLDEIETE